MYKNIICFLRNSGVKERVEDGWVCIHSGVTVQFSVNRFFVLLSRDWYRANSKHKSSQLLYVFQLQDICKAPFLFLLEAYPFSTLASLILHISLLSRVCFFPTSLHRASSIMSRHLIIISRHLIIIQLRPFSITQPGADWLKASSVMSSDSSAGSIVLTLGRKSSVVITFSRRLRNPQGHTLPSGMPPTQFTCFVYLKIQVHILFCHPCNLRGHPKESSCRYSTLHIIPR